MSDPGRKPKKQSKLNSYKFAAFVMTYERPEVALQTVKKLLDQSLPPEKILVVDNSDTDRTEDVFNCNTHGSISYFRVGNNSGPAGAACYGLKILADEGFDWIYWGDDDDPPKANSNFKELFEVLERAQAAYDDVGIVGKGAGKFNRLTSRTSSFMNRELHPGIMEGDFVPGNNVSIISGEMVRQGVLPTSELFFGFEELDFCLKAKRRGYKIVFDAESFLLGRKSKGFGDPNYKWRGKSIGVSARLWRQYYSSRNILKVLVANSLWTALILSVVKIILKSIYGFKYGKDYGIKNFRIQWRALADFARNKYGRIDLSDILH